MVFKLDRTGACEEVAAEEFVSIPGLPLAGFTHDMFLQVRRGGGASENGALVLLGHWCCSVAPWKKPRSLLLVVLLAVV